MQMDKKQTLILFIIVLAFGFLGYQVLALVRDGVTYPSSTMGMSESRYITDESTPSALLQPTLTPKPVKKAPPVAATLQTPPTNSESSQPKSVDVAVEPQSRQRYLHLVSQYQLAKMQRRLLDEQAAIADAQHRIAVLKKETRQLKLESAKQQHALVDKAAAKLVSSKPVVHYTWTSKPVFDVAIAKQTEHANH